MHFELDLLGAHRHTQRCLCIIFLDGLIDFGLQLIQTVHWFIRYTWFPGFLILVRMSAHLVSLSSRHHKVFVCTCHLSTLGTILGPCTATTSKYGANKYTAFVPQSSSHNVQYSDSRARWKQRLRFSTACRTIPRSVHRICAYSHPLSLLGSTYSQEK